MPKLTSYYPYTILSTGGTESFDLSKSFDLYVIGPATTVTLSADMIFSTTGTLVQSMQFNILYTGGVTSDTGGGKSVTFFGTDLTDEQALTQLLITATYTGSAWSVGVVPYSIYSQQSIWGTQIVTGTIGTDPMADGKTTLAKLAPLSTEGYMLRATVDGVIEEFYAGDAGNVLIGTGTGIASIALTGDVLVDSLGVTSIDADRISTAMIKDDNITVDKVEANLTYELITFPVSFEAGEQCAYKIKMPFPGSIVDEYGIVTKVIAGTDEGTITLKNNAGTNMTGGVITFAASDPLGTAYDSTVTANNTFIAGDFISATTLKTTAGGKVLMTLKIVRS